MPSTTWLTIMVLSITLASACFITNCPTGGKRSSSSDSDHFTGRQCSGCGSRGGRCLGARICCHPEAGCRIGGRDSLACRAEDFLSLPCDNLDLVTCGESEGFDGRCAAQAVCCSTDRCIVDESCKSSKQRMAAIGSRDLVPLLSAVSSRSNSN